MQARYYDPTLGRFLSKDPVGFAEGGVGYFNRYSYVMNDPVNMVDPDGQEVVENGRLQFTVSVGASVSEVPVRGLSYGVDQAVGISIGPPENLGDIMKSALLGPVGAVKFEGAALLGGGAPISDGGSNNVGSVFGAILDADVGELGLSLGTIEDRLGSSIQFEGDLGQVGVDVFTPTEGSLAGSGIRASRIGTGAGVSAGEQTTGVIWDQTGSIDKPIPDNLRSEN